MTSFRLLTLLVFCLLTTAALAQQHRFGGVRFDSERYKRLPLKISSRSSEPGNARSLRVESGAFSVLDQGFMPGCGCCAIAHAMSLRRKLYFDTVCPEKKPAEIFSWSFLYNQLCPGDSCNAEVFLADVLNLLDSLGICPADTLAGSFPNDGYSCSPQPGLAHKTLAARYPIWKWKRVFQLPEEVLLPDDTAGLRAFRNRLVQAVIAEIDLENPVIVAIQYAGEIESCDRLFQKEPPAGQKMWGHAMLIVGYDDGETFELLNSFGSEWCDGGFVRVRYADFARVAREGYALLFEEKIMDCTSRR